MLRRCAGIGAAVWGGAVGSMAWEGASASGEGGGGERRAVSGSLMHRLALAVGPQNLQWEDLEQYSKDAWSFHRGQRPSVVVYPSTTEEVASIVRECAAERTAVIAYGGGTSLEGHTLPTGAAVTVDLSRRMKGVLAVHEEDGDCVVLAGTRWEEVNEELARRGSRWFFAVDPGPGATLGGMIAASCSGTNAVRWGTMRDNVLSLKVVGADGAVFSTGSRARKSSAGLDLTRLMVGSEGTLGIVTEAVLRLRPRPAAEQVTVVPFASLREAADTVIELLQSGADLNCVEILNPTMVAAINEQSATHLPVQPHLFFKFSGSQDQVRRAADQAIAIAQRHGALSALIHTAPDEDPQARAKLWHARKVALWSAAAMHPDAKTVITDVCVPISQLAAALQATQDDIDASLLRGRAYIVGHAGDGNYHVFLSFDPADPSQAQAAHDLADRMARRAIHVGGTCTGEHGVGLGKKHLLTEEFGPEAVQVMWKIKHALDPHNILNPGKKLPPQ